MLSSLTAGFLMRALQVIVESSPYLLIGFCTAGALRTMVPPGRLRAFFGTGRWSGSLRAWATATLLPVCALGVLPILGELRRARVGWPTILTFALAGPMLGPVSIVHGFASLGPEFMALWILGSFVVSIGSGVSWAYLVPDEPFADGPDAPQCRRSSEAGSRRPGSTRPARRAGRPCETWRSAWPGRP